eukprot:7183073-Lingulodinium_polyedra.AAC.1
MELGVLVAPGRPRARGGFRWRAARAEAPGRDDPDLVRRAGACPVRGQVRRDPLLRGGGAAHPR